jgi:hypothetical protein
MIFNLNANRNWFPEFTFLEAIAVTLAPHVKFACQFGNALLWRYIDYSAVSNSLRGTVQSLETKGQDV